MKNMKLSRGGGKLSSVKTAFAKRIGKLCVAGAAMLAAGAAEAAEIQLSTTATDIGNSATAGQGNTYIASGESGSEQPTGIIKWSDAAVTSVGFSGTLTGTGNVQMLLKQGSGNNVANVNLATGTFSGFTGQLLICNIWNNNVLVKASGDGFANTEYLFGGVSKDRNYTNVRAYDSTQTWKGVDELRLTGDTTFAGITGTQKGATYATISVNSKEFITVETADTALTIAGAGTYAYFGSVGAADKRVSIAKTGAGSQEFGGSANYLKNLAVSGGTMTLSGTTTVAGAATVASSATLALDGQVGFADAVANSGTVTVAPTTLFNLPAAKKGEYTIVSGGTITGWDALTIANFGVGGVPLSSDMYTVDTGTEGVVKVSLIEDFLAWTGEDSGVWSLTGDENWIDEDGMGTVWNTSENALFTADGKNKAITITDDEVDAAKVVVNAPGSEYSVAGNGKALVGDLLEIDAGTFAIGDGDGKSVTFTFDDIVVNSGATFKYNNGYSELEKITLNGGNFEIFDLGGEAEIGKGGVSIGAIDVHTNSTMHGAYANSAGTLPVVVGTLTGAGNLSIAQNKSGIACEPYVLSVGDMSGYTGKLTAGSLITAEITVPEGAEYSNVTLGAGNAKIVKKGEGTLKAGEKITFAGKIQIDEGVFDANGFENAAYGIILNGGTFVNNGTALRLTQTQTAGGLQLTADSTISGTNDFGVIALQYGATTTDMGGHTLTKTGTNAFVFAQNTFTNGGAIVVQEGILTLGYTTKPITIGTTDILVKNGGRLNLAGASNFTGTSTVTFESGATCGGTFNKTGWAGTVELQSKQTGTVNFNNWGTANSKVRVAGSDGCNFAGGTIQPVIDFDGDFTVNNGSSGATVTFNGVTGKGNVGFVWGATGTAAPVVITKISDYTGTLAATTKMPTTVKALVWTDEVTAKVKVLSVDATNGNVTLESLVDAEGAALDVALTKEADGWYAEPKGGKTPVAPGADPAGEYDSEEAAEAAIGQYEFTPAAEVSEALDDTQLAAYKAMFELKAVEKGDKWGIAAALTEDAETDLQEQVDADAGKILAPVDGKATIDTTPGFYYAVSTGTDLTDETDWKETKAVLATGTTLEVDVTTEGDTRFYKVKVYLSAGAQLTDKEVIGPLDPEEEAEEEEELF